METMTAVLLVEDQDTVREVLAEVLEDGGNDVIEASTGEEALDVISRRGPPEVLVTDLDLGEGLSGLSLADNVARDWPQVGIVFISGRPWLMQHHPLRAQEYFLEKPCPANKLLETVEKLRSH
jgi:CheY-like chemotaxis protein